jgi:hypothetical protein
MDTESIPRDVAKWLLQSLIAMKTAQLAANATDNYTGFDKDSLAVKLGSGAIGMVVSRKLEPVTDKIVDSSADFIVEKWTKFRAKKNDKKKD